MALKVEPKKVHVRKGDTVAVLSGDDAGKTGKVIEVQPKKSRVVVDGVNILKKHSRPSKTNPQGGIVERPGPMAASKVMVVCPNCEKPTRIKRERTAAGGATRLCKHCGKAID